MALPDRPVVAVVGDGSSLYAVQALWSAAPLRRRAAVRRARQRPLRDHGPAGRAPGGKAPWPAFDEVRLAAIARALGCAAERINGTSELLAAFDDVLPRLRDLDRPLVLDVDVVPEREFAP